MKVDIFKEKYQKIFLLSHASDPPWYSLEKRYVLLGTEVNKWPYWFRCECKKEGVIKASLYAECYSLSSLFLTFSMPLSTPNRMIVKFKRKYKECTSSGSGSPGPSNRTLHLIKRNLKNNPHCKASDIAKNVDVSPRIAIRHLHKLGYYDWAARKKPLLCPLACLKGSFH